jgi:hypothetical protein
MVELLSKWNSWLVWLADWFNPLCLNAIDSMTDHIPPIKIVGTSGNEHTSINSKNTTHEKFCLKPFQWDIIRWLDSQKSISINKGRNSNNPFQQGTLRRYKHAC